MSSKNTVPIHLIEDFEGFEKRDKIAYWIFKLDKDFVYRTDFKTEYFHSEWLTIFEGGYIKIHKGYAWDGCSIKISILDLCVFGTPDGVLNIKTMKPKTYYASLVHDALYQYMGYHNLTRNQADLIFYSIMKENRFFLRWIYFKVVRFIGGIFFWKQKAKIARNEFYRNNSFVFDKTEVL